MFGIRQYGCRSTHPWRKNEELSTDAELSYIYTNHSIRATAITVLDECGYEARRIMAVSGHKSENSIRSYAARTSLSKKRKMSEALSFSTSENKIISVRLTVFLDWGIKLVSSYYLFTRRKVVDTERFPCKNAF